MKKGVKYDYKEAYNKNLKPSARLHYLENARHDQDSPAKMGHKSPAKKYGSPMEKHCTPMKKYGSPMKMGGHAIHKHMSGSPLNFVFGEAARLEEDMPVVKDATGGRIDRKANRKKQSLERKASRVAQAESLGKTRKAERLKRSIERKQSRMKRK